jgi:hypothetical protein
MLPLVPQTRHEDMKRLLNTGNWFLKSEIFQKWRDDEGSDLLACYGIPGAEKTIIRYGNDRSLGKEGILTCSVGV